MHFMYDLMNYLLWLKQSILIKAHLLIIMKCVSNEKMYFKTSKKKFSNIGNHQAKTASPRLLSIFKIPKAHLIMLTYINVQYKEYLNDHI